MRPRPSQCENPDSAVATQTVPPGTTVGVPSNPNASKARCSGKSGGTPLLRSESDTELQPERVGEAFQ
jgi:hypothetical protein